MIHVFIGTKAQYVKMAPLLRRMDDDGIAYRLIDSGQHADLVASFRDEFGLRDPDFCLGGVRNVDTVAQALGWTLRLAGHFVSSSKLRREVFGGRGGVCVIHGDTPTTLLSALMARRAGLVVAQVEAGLRTYSWLHPFPEEIVRVIVARLSHVLFAPSAIAVHNLRRSGVKGRIVEQTGNTVMESVRAAIPGVSDVDCASTAVGEVLDVMPGASPATGLSAPVVVTMHRVENLNRRSRRSELVGLTEALTAEMPVRWVMHGPTERAVSEAAKRRLAAVGVELVPLVSHAEFLAMLAAAPFVITDGGSIQEECAMLGVPTLVWRDRTDREDGLGENVVLSRYDPTVVQAFIADPQRYRRPACIPDVSPSVQILAELEEWR